MAYNRVTEEANLRRNPPFRSFSSQLMGEYLDVMEWRSNNPDKASNSEGFKILFSASCAHNNTDQCKENDAVPIWKYFYRELKAKYATVENDNYVPTVGFPETTEEISLPTVSVGATLDAYNESQNAAFVSKNAPVKKNYTGLLIIVGIAVAAYFIIKRKK